MTLLPAVMMAITLTLTVVMVPKLYLSWLKAERLIQEGEVATLRELLCEQNGWVKRHFACGVTGLALVCLMMRHQPAQSPTALTDSVALYVTISLILAIVESLLAQKIADRLALSLAAVRMRNRKQG